MHWEYFGTTLFFMVIGYLIGSISWAIILTKKIHKKDVRSHGSMNAGATNVLRMHGKKLAFLVFILDVIKPLIIMVIAFIFKQEIGGIFSGMIIPIIGLGALIGHIYPIFFNFKGGKGAATFVGLMLGCQWLLVIIGIITFITLVLIYKKVSLASMTTSFLLVIISLMWGFIPYMTDAWSMPMTQGSSWWITTLSFAIGLLFLVWAHRANIKRLINGTETKIIK